METKLSIMERTLRILVKGSREGLREFGRRDVISLVKEEAVDSVNRWSALPPVDQLMISMVRKLEFLTIGSYLNYVCVTG
uniref:Uncharacterized protein n=1 Tax=Magallana gigas TaxID=29159 RepID=K1QVH8_MAGGI